MKRTLKSLLVIAGLAIIGLCSGLTPAQAAVTCTPVFPTTPGYPYGNSTQYCGAATQANASKMVTAVNAAHGFAFSELHRANVSFALFHTPAEYQQNFPASGGNPVPGTNDFGVTKFDSQNRPIFSAIFELNAAGQTNIYIAHATGVEASKGLDYLLGYVMNGGVQAPVNSKVSDSSLFQTQLNADLAALNTKRACKDPASAALGVFSTWADSTSTDNPPNYHYICNGTNGNGTALAPGYSGSNSAVLNQAWPAIYPSRAAIFAETYSWTYMGKDIGTPRSADIYIAGTGEVNPPNFQCTKWLVKFVGDFGKIPTATNDKPAACPTPAFISVCVKIFNNSGYYPDGNVFNCTGDGMPAIVANNLRSLGGSTSFTPIKSALASAQSNVYLFNTAAQYTSTFQNAGQPAATFPAAANGATYPNANMWYSIVQENGSSAIGTNSTLAGAVVAHELGHVVDNKTGYFAASTAFDTVVQNDWLYLDYENATQTTPRLPCGRSGTGGYTGPLVGSIDPTTNALFCAGTTLETKWAGKRVSEIMRTVASYGLYTVPSAFIGFNPGVTDPAGWSEMYATAFGVVADYNISGLGAARIFERAVQNGYFGCVAGDGTHNPTQGWMYFTYFQLTFALPAKCTAALPGWWVPLH